MLLRELAAKLGIPRRTIQLWVERDPELSVLKKNESGNLSHWIVLDRFVGRHGITLIDAYTLGFSPWVKAVDVAKMAGISRKTVANWCRDRPGFAKRLGRIYYIDLSQFGATSDQVVEVIKRLKEGISGQTSP